MADEQQHPDERRDEPDPRPLDQDEPALLPEEREGDLDDLLDEEDGTRPRGGSAGSARLAVALVGAFLLGALVAWLIGMLGGSGPEDGDRVAFAELVGMDSTVEDTEVEVLESDDGRLLRVFPVEMPDVADGYAQVWVTDSQGSELVPLGVIEEGQTDVPVPATLDLGRYPVVEISLEPYDGDPGHGGRPLWRGQLDVPAA